MNLLHKRIQADHFAPPLDHEFLCPICHNVLSNPLQTIECGHCFCKECIENALNHRKVCPLDNIELKKEMMFLDKKTERQIFAKEVKCPNEGCDWKNCLSMVVEHLGKCLLENISCTLNCGIEMNRNKLQEHITTHCPLRITACPHCQTTFTFEKYKVHVGTCPDEFINCINQCGEKVKRKEIEDHRERSCMEEMVGCMFVNVGCDRRMKRREERMHLVELMVEHLGLLNRKMREADSRIKELEKDNALKSEEIQNLKLTVENQRYSWHQCGSIITICNYTTIEQSGTSYSYGVAITKYPLQDKKSFTVKIEMLDTKKRAVVVGVALKDINLDTHLTESDKGWGYTNHGSLRHGAGGMGVPAFGVGDFIKVEILENKVIFSKNSIRVGSLNCNHVSQELYPAVSFSRVGNGRVSFVS